MTWYCMNAFPIELISLLALINFLTIKGQNKDSAYERVLLHSVLHKIK